LMPRRKSHFKSQRGQVSGDSQLRQATVQAGQVPAERSRATSSHGEKVTGGQGVAGSNPAVPTGSRVFSNIAMPPPEPSKEPSHREMALPEVRADHVLRRSTRAFVKRTEPTKPAVKGSKIAKPPRSCTATPPAANRRTPSPAHRLTATRTLTRRSSCATRASRDAHAKPAPATSDATAADMRSAFGPSATTVASTTANALLS